MTLEEIVEQAIKTGYLTPSMEAEISRICEASEELTAAEYKALDRLMEALLAGEITASPKKRFINVMEELVVTEVINRVAEIETTTDVTLDVGDIAAYALNRLPPLYATTEEGASFQRQKAKQELQSLIVQRVEEAIERYLNCPRFYPERKALGHSNTATVFEQVSRLLSSQASRYETPSQNEE